MMIYITLLKIKNIKIKIHPNIKIIYLKKQEILSEI